MTLIAIISFSFIWVRSLPFNYYIKVFWWGLRRTPITERYKTRIKPFDCEVCLTFWLSLTYTLITTTPERAICLAFISAFTALVMTRLLDR